MEIKITQSVSKFYLGFDSIKKLNEIIEKCKENPGDYSLFIIDIFFKHKKYKWKNIISENDMLIYFDSKNEPTTDIINEYLNKVSQNQIKPSAIIGIGGGSTLDTAKAISNLLNNPGKAEDYQGWDLLKNKGVYKIGIPTISGTGAESSRTCVMMNYEKNLKLGMNSEFTMFDFLILDPNLTKTVPRDQFFYTAMDTFIHCIESLNGSFKNSMSDSLSHEAIRLCDEVFSSEDMMSSLNREKLMVASYLGGTSIANTYVGLIHPFSAGLSVVLGYHHCYANCLVFNVMEEYYPQEYKRFKTYLKKQNINLPTNLLSNLSEVYFENLYKSTIIHEKPLINALGEDFKSILTYEKVKSIFKKI